MRHSLSSIGWRRGPGRGGGHPSPRSSPHSFVVGRGRRTRAGSNWRGPRRFFGARVCDPQHSGKSTPLELFSGFTHSLAEKPPAEPEVSQDQHNEGGSGSHSSFGFRNRIRGRIGQREWTFTTQKKNRIRQ